MAYIFNFRIRRYELRSSSYHGGNDLVGIEFSSFDFKSYCRRLDMAVSPEYRNRTYR